MENNSLHVIGLGVLDKFRRRGVAGALVRAMMRLARERGMGGIEIRTVKETGNVPIFERMGFQVVSEAPDRYADSDRYPALTDVALRMEVPEGKGG